MSIPKSAPSAQLEIEAVIIVSEIDRQKFQDTLNEYLMLSYELTHFSTTTVDITNEDSDSCQDVEFSAVLQISSK